MNQFPLFIQKTFLSKTKRANNFKKQSDLASVEFSLTEQIARYIPLLELQDRRQLLQVEVVGNCHPQSYQSMIMGVDFMKQLLLLDSPTPINPYCPIILGDQLIVRHRQQGQVLSFSGTLADIISDGDSLLYAMELPLNIAYQQRRFYPRLFLSENMKNICPLSIKIKSPLKMPWHCQLKNISAGGMRLSVPGKVSPQLAVGKVLPTATIQMDELSISSPLTIKSFRHERKPYEQTEISVAFTQIGVQDRVRLQSFISFYLDTSRVASLTS